MAGTSDFTVTVRHLREFEFNVSFDWEGVAPLLLDEPEPLGNASGPNASRLVAAAVGNCLTASLLFCLRKSGVEADGVVTTVRCTVAPNEHKRLRLARLDARIELPLGVEKADRLDRCLEIFEDYCVVTESVRHGFPVRVDVVSSWGDVLLTRE